MISASVGLAINRGGQTGTGAPVGHMPLSARAPVWYYSSLMFGFIFACCAVAYLIDARTLQGVSVWSKPLKFALSLGLYFYTLNWFSHLARTAGSRFVDSQPVDYFASRSGHLLLWLMVFCGFAEMFYIILQATLGEASHFNYSSFYHQVMYSLMGVGAVTLVLGCLWLAWVVSRRHSLAEPFVLAVVAGLVLTFLLGGLIGGYLSAQGGHWVGGVANDAQGLPLVGWATQGGDLRVAHFFGMHSMQVLPMFAAMLVVVLPSDGRSSANKLQWWLVVGATVFYTLLTLYTLVQATGGNPLFGSV